MKTVSELDRIFFNSIASLENLKILHELISNELLKFEEKEQPKQSPYEEAFNELRPTWYIFANNTIDSIQSSEPIVHSCSTENHHTSEESCIDTQKYIKRKLIAERHGACGFIDEKEIWIVEFSNGAWRVGFYDGYKTEGTNYFPTEKQAEAYLNDCLKEDLL